MMPLAGVASSMIASLSGPGTMAQTMKIARTASPEYQKLVKAAGEFESMLLDSLWKSMKETFKDPNDPDSDATLQSFDDWGMKSMADAVGNAGGLGIKSMILKYLEPAASGGSSGATPNL
jgi:Rod binding domain-containing protein